MIGIGYYMLVVFGLVFVIGGSLYLFMCKRPTGAKGKQTYLGGEDLEWTGTGANYYQQFEKSLKRIYPALECFHKEDATYYIFLLCLTLAALLLGGYLWI
ncbi:MAG: hypothetical protein ABH829_02405 [archaeon]